MRLAVFNQWTVVYFFQTGLGRGGKSLPGPMTSTPITNTAISRTGLPSVTLGGGQAPPVTPVSKHQPVSNVATSCEYNTSCIDSDLAV